MIKDKNIDGGKAFDWGFTSEEYAKYRDIYPPELYKRLRELGVAADGTSWLDLGTGTGILPLNLYNPNAEIYGADISDGQIELARRTAKEKGYNISYIISPAEATGFDDGAFDCITAAQCFSYFDRDAMRSEIKRLLKPRGRLIKIYMDWSLDDEIAAKSVSLVKEHNPSWDAGENIYDDIYDDLFEGRVTESVDFDIPFTRDTWHGRMCACRGTLASMSKEQFYNWSDEHIKMLQSYPPEFTIKHTIYITLFEL
ncbi:MAG: class I SAM-dependent methyltransferase [Eubacterium sp.]|nr:class I SAM-dependent methyltransferase [Eubacterium sp.]